VDGVKVAEGEFLATVVDKNKGTGGSTSDAS